MLQRLAKVLDVPGRMSKFMKLAQYEDVVKEYERVKGLRVGGGMSLLKRVQDQAEIVAEELRRKLRAYVSSEAHVFEDLQEASDLLRRLGGTGEPLLFCFVEQHNLLRHSLDALDDWYGDMMETALRHKVERDEAAQRSQLRSEDKMAGKGRVVDIPANLMAVAAAARDRSKSFGSDGSYDSEEIDLSDAPLKNNLRSPLLQLRRGPDDASDHDHSEGESDFSGEEAGGDDSAWGFDFSVNVDMDSIEHESASLRLNLVRKMVKEAQLYLPTLIRLSGLIVDELESTKVLVDVEKGLITVIKHEEKPKLGAVPNPDEQNAGVAVSDKVCKTLQRISKTVRKAMFGEPGGSAAVGSVQLQALTESPLASVYFREALRSASELYDNVFVTEGDNLVTKAALPSLRALVEEGQVQHTQNVLRRLREECGSLHLQEDWLLVKEERGRGDENVFSAIQAGTRLPHLFFTITQAAFEELANYLIRPYWSAQQVSVGFETCVTQLLANLGDPANPAVGNERMQVCRMGCIRYQCFYVRCKSRISHALLSFRTDIRGREVIGLDWESYTTKGALCAFAG